MHAGEFAHSLMPWIPIPVTANPQLGPRAIGLAKGFDLLYLDLRTELETIPAFARYLAEQDIADIWNEIGQNGLVEPENVVLQYEGCLNALRAVGKLAGKPSVKVRHRYIGHQHYSLVAEQSGIWYPAIRAGQFVRAGQLLGELRDYFGDLIERYYAPSDGIILYYSSSPAINSERRPHGYAWHASLLRMASLHPTSPISDLTNPPEVYVAGASIGPTNAQTVTPSPTQPPP